MQFSQALARAIDLTAEQYEALHDGRRVTGLAYEPFEEFVIDRAGCHEDKHFQDIGIEYYRYVDKTA
jgi:hydroxymethylglutaryl-CoA synthase